MMNQQTLTALGVALALTPIITACSVDGFSPASQRAKPEVAQDVPPNLISLFLVKRDNLTNEFRGEVYPIALLINGTYIDASQDLTNESRLNASEDYLLRTASDTSMLKAIKTFTVLNDAEPLGSVTINQLGVSSFACSKVLVGRGSVADQPLSSVFVNLPDKTADGLNGYLDGQQVNETWRSTIAVSQQYPTQPATLKSSQPEQYRQDILATAQRLLAQDDKARTITGKLDLEQVSVFDLNQDGQPEVFGIVRKQAERQANNSTRQPVESAYINIWLGYADQKPQTLNSKIAIGSEGTPAYELLAIQDFNGDGTQEAIVRQHGYESTSFGIYRYQNNRLQQVFNGAGYGC